MEWDAQVGRASEFGGNAMIRASVFWRLGGFDERFIAGEEPELAARMALAGKSGALGHDQHRGNRRQEASEIVRLRQEMALHDSAMMRFSQWWRRTKRSGHALAQLAHAHGRAPLYFYSRQRRSTLLWALGVPLLLFMVALWLGWECLALVPT